MVEKTLKVSNGWLVLLFVIIGGIGIPAFWMSARSFYLLQNPMLFLFAVIAGVVLPVVVGFVCFGFFTVQPNEGRILILFGKYRGTVRQEGFHWANPFSVSRGSISEIPGQPGKTNSVKSYIVNNKYRVSLRARNFQTGIIKVNDQRGNPIEISAVVVWRVIDTAQALFEVDDYNNYVLIQSESALRQLASTYPYDHSEQAEKETTLRGNADVVCAALIKELQSRLNPAGVKVEEARLTHLVYASEIAPLMLRRQQAEAIIAARQKIVHGAVSMVEMALHELSEKHVVVLDEERKAAMVSNLLVVLCGEAEVQPVVNTGTLYQ